MIEIIRENNGFFIMSYIGILLLLICSLRKKGESELLSKQDSISLKAISAIFIVFHHLSQMVGISIVTLPFIEIGKYSVALFLFLSGYGVMISYIKSKIYIKGFLIRRVLTIYIPFSISNMVFICIKLFKGEIYTVIDMIRYIIGIDLIDGSMWFIIAIIIFYLIFYLSFRFTSIKNGSIILIILSSLYIIIGVYLGLGTYIVNIGFAFSIGILFAINEKKVIDLLENRYLFKVSISIFILILCRVLSIVSTNNYLREFILNISTCSYAILIVILTFKFKFTGIIISLLGKISFEIYLLHNKFIYINTEINKSVLSILMYFIFLILCSYIFNIINNKILEGIKNNKLKIYRKENLKM